MQRGAFRVLLPTSLKDMLGDMATATQCVVSRGQWPAMGLRDGIEILFDDGTADPFAVHLAVESFDRLPAATDNGREFILTVWMRGPKKVLTRPWVPTRAEDPAPQAVEGECLMPPHFADALDQLRELVEADGRPVAELAEAIDPPMAKQQLHQVLSGGRRSPSIETVARISPCSAGPGPTSTDRSPVDRPMPLVRPAGVNAGEKIFGESVTERLTFRYRSVYY